MVTIFSVLKSVVNILLIGLRNALLNAYFLTPQYIEWGTHQILCVPNIKKNFNFKFNIVFRIKKLRNTTTELGSKETYLKT